ncbi:unnamed protein product [Cyprideis torosa]|uniref:Uncharacterized protein n=1 Tax=Cyprideis torosa TaxID=163714 RepID=A0A7R8ZKT6_9CRUS|nr:unnamed protein product [Cyprideis torosa]CAG0885087.1 unnamed protein product [Cyprideis torosa]
MTQVVPSGHMERRSAVMPPGCEIFFPHDPLKIKRAQGQYMFDEDGNRFLDCINNVCHVGHCHPKVADAVSKQMSILNTNSRFLYDSLPEYLEKLTALFPPPLKIVYLVNSGSEANDLALRLAFFASGSKDVIALEHAYHGQVTSAFEISHYKWGLKRPDLQPSYVHIASCPDSYRGKYSHLPPEEVSQAYVSDLDTLIQGIHAKGKKIGAFIAESAMSCAGQVMMPKGYLASVYETVRNAGGVCIADEVQVGFGRCGDEKWWFFEDENVIPDIVTLGKPIGNGFPMAAVVTTRAIAGAMAATGMEQFSTFAGNPVSCMAGLAVIEVLEDEKLRENATVVGDVLLEGFRELQKKHDIIGDVRGKGLFIGVDLVTDRYTKTPATNSAKIVVNLMRDRHKIILSRDGPYSNVLKLKPPMCFSLEDAKTVLTCLDEVLSDLALKNP